MRPILHTLIILSCLTAAITIGIKSQLPAALKISARECPFSLDMEKIPVMVVRVIDNSTLPKEFSRRCFLEQMSDKEGIIFINRENEPQILNELAHQSEIPTSDKSLLPIGEILVPSHLYVINEKNNNVEVSLSEIKSGIFIFKEEFEYNPILEKAKKNSELIFKTASAGLSFPILMFFLYISTSPLFQWLKKREEISQANHDFRLAQKYIEANNIYEGGNLLVKCAQSVYESNSKKEALRLLTGMNNFIKE